MNPTPRPRRAAVLVFLLIVTGVPALLAPLHGWSRPRQKPPSLALRTPPNVIIAARLEAVDGHILRLSVRETLFGADSRAVLGVQAPMAALADLEAGRDYLVVYNDSRRDPMRPKRMMPHPGGPRLVYEPGAEPALFADTPVFRELLSADTACLLGLDRRGRERLFDGLRSDDAKLQYFLAVDLYMCPDVRAGLSRSERRAVAAVAGEDDAHPLARGWLLRILLEDPDAFGDRGRTVATAILERTPVDVGDSQPAEMVRMTLSALEIAHIDVPAAALERWLYTDSASLAELALLALRRQAPALERAALDKALATERVPAATRAFLEDHARRLRLQATR